jgi:putative transposase
MVWRRLLVRGDATLADLHETLQVALGWTDAGLNNRAENAHRPVRNRERVLQRFKSPEHAQRFLEPFSAMCNHSRPRRHLLSAERYRQIRTERFRQWREVARLQPAA